MSEITTADWTWINAAADRFERAWKSGQRPKIEAYLAEVDEARWPRLLEELLRVEIELRRRADEEPTAEEFRGRFPENAAVVDTVFAPLPGQPAQPDATPTAGFTPCGETEVEGPGPGAHVRYFGDYELMGELGRGGMGIVYAARQISLDRPVALKMIRSAALASEDELRRFQNEVEAVAKLDHPNIVPIYEVGEHEGRRYFSMKLIGGRNLQKVLDDGAAGPKAAAELMITIAEAVHHAHQRGILHRDLKPSNIMLDENGRPHVGDFGLAKRVGGVDQQTITGAVLGTPAYMAPEQAWGRKRLVTVSTDVYGLGAVLYTLLTGKPPFTGDSDWETLVQVREKVPVQPSLLTEKLPRDLEIICLKCLEKDPQRRYASAQEVASDLRRFLAGEPITARRAMPWERAWLWCKRNPWLAAANVTAAAVTTILAIGSTIAAKVYYDKSEKIADQARKLERSDIDTREKLFEAQLQRARAGRFSHRAGQRFESLAAVAEAAKIGRELRFPVERFDRLRDEAIACMALPDLKPIGRVIPRPSGVIRAAFDPTMSRYVLRFRDGTISVRRFTDDQEIARFQARGDRDLWVFGFSPNGRYLATTHFPDGTLTVWDVDRRGLAVSDPCPIWGAARFSPDSRRIVLARNGKLLFYDLATGRLNRTWPGRASCLAFRADGAQIAVIDNATCRILEGETGRLVQTFSLRSGAADVAWSPDGTTLATPSDDYKIDLWDTATGDRRATLEGQNNSGLSAAFHPAGTLLASNGFEGRLRLWDPVVGRPLLSVTSAFGPDFSQDGRIVVADEDKLTTYQVDPALEYRTFAHVSSQPIDYMRASIHRDGRLLAVGTDQGVVLWDLARGTELAFLPIGMAWHSMFDPTGDLLTNGAAGVLRWPVRLDAGRGELRIGPPSALPLPGSDCGIACDRTGRIVAVAGYGQAHVVTAQGPISVGPLDDCRAVAVSPDGKWLATGSHAGNGAEVWRVRDATRVAHLAIEGFVSVLFSPDGRWLMTTSPPCRLWAVDTWQEARRIDGHGLSFTPDGRLLVVQDADKALRLVETKSGHRLARLESPDLCAVKGATFSPDGSRLVVTTNDGRAVHVWDLRAIRKHLAGMGLDWDAPPFSQGTTRNEPAASGSTLKVKIVKAPGDYHELSFELMRQGKLDEAISMAREGVDSLPQEANCHATLGHMLRRAGRWDEAVASASKAVQLQPDYYWNHQTLAWAYLGKGDWDRSIAEYRETIRLRPDDPVTHYELGLAYQGKTEYAGAEREYREAIRLGHASDPAAHHELASCLEQEGIFEEAIAELKSAIALKPDFAPSQNRLAWILSACPERRLRDGPLALEHARKAVSLEPRQANSLNTLALAEYRTGHWAESLAASEKAINLRKAPCACDWFFMAMALWQKGEKDKARTWFDKAVAWTREKDPKNKELLQFWKEAGDIMGQPVPQAAATPSTSKPR